MLVLKYLHIHVRQGSLFLEHLVIKSASCLEDLLPEGEPELVTLPPQHVAQGGVPAEEHRDLGTQHVSQ